MVSQNLSQAADKKALISCMIVAIIFTIACTAARWYKFGKLPIQSEDICILAALICFVIMTILYLEALPTYFNVIAVEAGTMLPYASLETDLAVMLKLFFVVQFFFWLTLWAVKLSLLFMFRRLTLGLTKFERFWWVVLVVTVATFVGCVVSQFTSCHSMSAWFTAGQCETPHDAVAKAASLWYSLAVDLLTDLMIMSIPLCLLWNLQISRSEKFSVGVVFVVGILTMIFAIIRTVSLDSSTSDGEVSTTWLIFWAAIEGLVAIIVGCLPAFAILIRSQVVQTRIRYYTDSSARQPQSSRSKSKARTESVLLDKLEPISHAGNLSKRSLTSNASAWTAEKPARAGRGEDISD